MPRSTARIAGPLLTVLASCLAGNGCLLRQSHHDVDLAPPAKDPPSRGLQRASPLTPVQSSQPDATGVRGCELLQDPSDRVRADAVGALARCGDRQAVLGAAEDKSWRVRLRVAQALRSWPDRESAVVAMRLIEDSSPEVQQQAVASVAHWPLERSGPVLLQAMSSAVFLTRKLAAERLAAQWTAASTFPAEGPAPRRAEVLVQLQQRFHLDVPAADDAHVVAATAAPSETGLADLQRVEHLLRAQDMKGLSEIGPGLVEAIEVLVVDREQAVPAAVYHEVLPRCGEVYSILDRLGSPDVAERRRAARELAVWGKKGPLGRLAAARLSELVAPESDALVWQSVLEAVAAEPAEPAVRLAYTALGHASPEVRRRACEHLAAHPAPAHCQLLVPLLKDGSHTVVIAAVRALGLCGPPEQRAGAKSAEAMESGPAGSGPLSSAGPQPRPLQQLREVLASTNEEVQLEAAIALARWTDREGPVALERLTYSADPQIRTRVAQGMGELGDSSFAPALVRLLDDRRTAVSRAALAALPKVAGRDVAHSPDGPRAGTAEQIRRWKQWASQSAS